MDREWSRLARLASLASRPTLSYEEARQDLEVAHAQYAAAVPLGVALPESWRPESAPSAPKSRRRPTSAPLEKPTSAPLEKKPKDEQQLFARPPRLPPVITPRLVEHFGSVVSLVQSSKADRRPEDHRNKKTQPAQPPTQPTAPPKRKAFHPNRIGPDTISADERRRNASRALKKEREDRERQEKTERQKAEHCRRVFLDFAAQHRGSGPRPSSARPRSPAKQQPHARRLSPSAQRHANAVVERRTRRRQERLALASGHILPAEKKQKGQQKVIMATDVSSSPSPAANSPSSADEEEEVSLLQSDDIK